MSTLPPVSGLLQARVLEVRHWTDTLFSFTTERDSGFRFHSGQFTMVGLPVEGRPLLRAYSMVSAQYDDHLEFLSIKIPDGRLTSRLKEVRPGDAVYVSRKATGTLVPDQLLPGRRLWLLSTGTGIAPFISLLRDPGLYEQFDAIVLTHTCRTAAELAYRDYLSRGLFEDPLVGEQARAKFTYCPTITREPFTPQGRITALLESGELIRHLGVAPLSPRDDRLMLCGSPGMLTDLRALLTARGFEAGAADAPGHFVWEKAFAEG